MSKTQIIDEILKSHKKPGFRSFFKRWIFRKTVGRGGQIDLPAVSGLNTIYKFFDTLSRENFSDDIPW